MKQYILLASLSLALLIQQSTTGGIKISGGVRMGSGIVISNACAPPNFCSPTNGGTGQTSFPVATLGGLTGVGAIYTDPVSGNIITRITDYTMSGGTTGSSSFRAPSDSNDETFNSDDTIIYVCRTGGAAYLIAWNGSTHVPTPKGTTGGNGACDAFAWSAVSPTDWFGVTAPSFLNKYTINRSSPTWTGSTGGNTSLAAAISTTQLLDISTQCTGSGYTPYTFATNVYTADSAGKYVAFQMRLVQDQGYLIYLYDTTLGGNGCHWVNTRTMTQGGGWGSSAMSFANSILLPAPPAPSGSTSSAGSLISNHSYTLCITYVKNTVGETPCSPNQTVTLGPTDTEFFVNLPTASPSGTLTKATGINLYACDNTAVPGCTPVLQEVSNNPNGNLAQPIVNSATCTANCTNNGRTFTFRVVAENAGGESIWSAPFTTASVSTNASFTVNINQVTNATGYDIYLDDLVTTAVNNNAGSCGGGTCNITLNTNSNSVGFSYNYMQTVPITGGNPLVSTMRTGTPAPPVTNTTGGKIHDLKFDGTSKLTVSVVGGNFQTGYTSNAREFFNVNTGVMTYSSSTSTPALNAGATQMGHMVIQGNQFMGNDANSGLESVFTISDSSATMEASEICLSCSATHTTDVHFSGQGQVTNATWPWYIGSDRSGHESHSLPVTAYDGWIWATQNVANTAKVFVLCQNWSSGLQGFNSDTGGNVSRSWKHIEFATDGGIGSGITSGSFGDSSGNATCTDGTGPNYSNGTCRTDVFVCSGGHSGGNF